MTSETGYVYALTDPRTGNVRYIGATKAPETRLAVHLNQPTNEKMGGWIEGLRKEGFKPSLEILESCPIEELPDKELKIIEEKSDDCDLLNGEKRIRYPNPPAREGIQSEATEMVATATVQENGRCYIPKPVREKLGFDGEQVAVELEVRYE